MLNLQNNVLEHSNQVCIATLFALRDFLNDYRIGDSAADAAAAHGMPTRAISGLSALAAAGPEALDRT